ncbi:MAG: 50S ribosomal protein L32 [Myxococcota bacterium]
MPVPYGRKSRSKSRMQRAANMRYTPKTHNLCGNCNEPKASHHVCAKCGQYAGRTVIQIEQN